MKNSRRLVCLAALFVAGMVSVAYGQQYADADGYAVQQSVVYRNEPLLLTLAELPLQVTGLTLDMLLGTTFVVDEQPVYVQPTYDQSTVYTEPAYTTPAYVAPPVPYTYVSDPNWEPSDYWFWNDFEVSFCDGFTVCLCGGRWMYSSAWFTLGFKSYRNEHRDNWDHLRLHNERREWPGRHGGGGWDRNGGHRQIVGHNGGDHQSDGRNFGVRDGGQRQPSNRNPSNGRWNGGHQPAVRQADRVQQHRYSSTPRSESLSQGFSVRRIIGHQGGQQMQGQIRQPQVRAQARPFNANGRVSSYHMASPHPAASFSQGGQRGNWGQGQSQGRSSGQSHQGGGSHNNSSRR